jgi:23S rRNA (adenine2503-C2)-methyltransferase
MKNRRRDILGIEPDALRIELRRHFAERAEPAYRAGQVARWIFERDAAGFEAMSDLPLAEREALAVAFGLHEPEVERLALSTDGTAKHVWRLADGELVESVLIPLRGAAGGPDAEAGAPRDRLTLCISSQAGCAMGCTFCATGWSGFRRQLSAGEIVAQYRASRRWARENGYGEITNVVYMGMGEPFANRDAVFASLTLLNRGYGVGARRITVSTVGVVPGILALAERPEQFRLAVSLHAPDPELRRTLIPLEKRWSLEALMEALRRFDAAGGKRITFEYTMIDGVNDSTAMAQQLAALAAPLHAFVNLIPFNPIPYREWKATPAERIQRFRRVLEDRGVRAAVREPRGRDIDAACGQLRAQALVALTGRKERAGSAAG